MATLDTLTDLLARSQLFGSLDKAALAAVAGAMKPATFNAGQTIFQRGDAGRDLFLVLSGRVRLSVLTAEGRELSFAHATSGQVFGEMAALDGVERSADATAVTRVEAMTLAQPILRSLIEKTPGLAEAVITFLCRRLRDTGQQLEAIALHPIEVRLARLFVSLISAHRTPVAKNGRADLQLGMSQSELGLLIGASRPKVNGALAALVDMGLVVRTDAILSCDVEGLRDLAGEG